MKENNAGSYDRKTLYTYSSQPVLASIRHHADLVDSEASMSALGSARQCMGHCMEECDGKVVFWCVIRTITLNSFQASKLPFIVSHIGKDDDTPCISLEYTLNLHFDQQLKSYFFRIDCILDDVHPTFERCLQFTNSSIHENRPVPNYSNVYLKLLLESLHCMTSI